MEQGDRSIRSWRKKMIEIQNIEKDKGCGGGGDGGGASALIFLSIA